MPKFYGYIQPKIGWLYDRSDKYWVNVASGETYDTTRETTLEVIRAMNRGSMDKIVYVVSVRTQEERYEDNHND